jgi:hypothetical protein
MKSYMLLQSKFFLFLHVSYPMKNYVGVQGGANSERNICVALVRGLVAAGVE